MSTSSPLSSAETSGVDSTVRPSGGGRIVRLELQNFKSYAGKQIVGPFKNFTCIIGPNGAGKSNMMDAISFVVGLRAAYLRSDNLKQIIYNADQTAEQMEKSKRSAQVSLIFQPTNEQGEDEEEINFTRTISSSGISEYRINDAVVTSAQYENKLREYNVLIKARNFLVFQGDVESIASKSPMELTKLMEQISGSVEYKKEYDELKEKVELASERVMSNFQRKKGIYAEKNKFKLQKKEAERFEELTKEHDNVQVKFVLWKLYHIERKLRDHHKDLASLRDELQTLNNTQKVTEDQLKTKKEEAASVRRRALKDQSDMKKHASEENKRKSHFEEVKVEIAHLKKAISKREKDVETKSHQLSKNQKNMEKIRNELETVKNASLQYEKQVTERSQKEVEFLQTAELKEEYARLKDQSNTETVTLRQELNKYSAEIENLREVEKQIQARLEELEHRDKNLSNAQEQLRERFHKLTEVTSTFQHDYEQKRQEMRRMMQQSNDRKDQRDSIEKQLRNVKEQIKDARIEKNESEREARFKEALESMKRLFPGVQGRLADLCKVTRDKYNIAVSVALGRNINAVVCDKEKTALECIDYLREQRISTATFIPLDTIKSKKIDEKLRQDLSGDVDTTAAKLVIDVIQYDPYFDKAFRYALGNTIVCESLEDAMNLCYTNTGVKGNKAVTLDGSIVHKSGNITGGAAEVQGQAKSLAQSAPKVDINALKDKRDKYLQELQDNIREEAKSASTISQLETEISNLENKLKYTKVDMDLTEKKLNSTQNERKQVTEYLNSPESGRPRLGSIRNEISQLQARIDQLHNEVKEIEQKIFGEFAKKVGIENIREYEEQKLREERETGKRRSEFRILISRLENDLEYETRRGSMEDGGILERLRNQLEKDRKRLSILEESESNLSKQIETLQKKGKDLNQKLKDSREKVNEKELEINELKKIFQQNEQNIQRHMKHIAAKESQVDQLRSRRLETFLKCKLEEIELPTKPESEMTESEGGTARQKKRRRVADTSRAAEEEQEDYLSYSESFTQASLTAGATQQTTSSSQGRERDELIVLDFTSLDRDILPVETEQQYKKIESDFEEKMRHLEEEIEKLAPSLSGLDKADVVYKKYKQTEAQLEEAKEESKVLKKKFEEVKKKRRDTFLKAFEPIANAITVIYKQLTQSEESYTGGRGYLGVEDENEPYLAGVRYNVQPPSKRYREMEHLSGGEKTVAALALLFAIHSYRPSPFFVLDEVDAALDSVNVSKVVNFVRRRSPDCQFIVISLKEHFYSMADSLIGVYRDAEKECSGTLTLDLTQYAPAASVTADQTPTTSTRKIGVSSTPSSSKVLFTPLTTEEGEEDLPAE